MEPSSTDRDLATLDAAPGAPEAPSSPPARKGRLAFPVLLSLAVMVVIAWFTYEPDAFQRMWTALHPGILAAGLIFLVLRVWFSGLRLQYISRGRLSFPAALRTVFVWEFASNITPSTIGGAPFAALYVSRTYKVPFGETTSIILFSVLLDQCWFTFMIPSLLLASLYVDIFPSSLGATGATLLTLVFLGMLAWAALFAYYTLFRPDLLQKLVARVFSLKRLRRFQQRVAVEMDNLRERARVIRQQPPRFFVKGFLLSAGMWISRYLILLLIVWSVYPELPRLQFLARTVAMMILSMVVPTPGGSGGVEGMYALFLGPLMPKGLVAPTLLTWRLLAYYLFIAAGLAVTTTRRARPIHLRNAVP